MNPCTYRGYYYDQETGYYYLQSRYYNPDTGRFLNADDANLLSEYISTAQCNIFTYCKSNPINNYDPNGYWLISISVKVAAIVLDVIIMAITVIAINYLKLKALNVLRRISGAIKKLWDSLVTIIGKAIVSSINWIMKTFFSKYTGATAARLNLGLAVVKSFINSYISYTAGYMIARLIDQYDRDGKSGYIRF